MHEWHIYTYIYSFLTFTVKLRVCLLATYIFHSDTITVIHVPHNHSSLHLCTPDIGQVNINRNTHRQTHTCACVCASIQIICTHTHTYYTSFMVTVTCKSCNAILLNLLQYLNKYIQDLPGYYNIHANMFNTVTKISKCRWYCGNVILSCIT